MLQRNTPCSVLWLLVTVNAAPSSSNLVTLMMEVIHSFQTPVLTRAMQHNILEYQISLIIDNLLSWKGRVCWFMSKLDSVIQSGPYMSKETKNNYFLLTFSFCHDQRSGAILPKVFILLVYRRE
jgi:hypothetical protein